MRVWNFSAGPAALPLEVLEQARDEFLEWNGMGASVIEISHRSAPFIELAERIEANFRTLLTIPDDYAVVFTTGGATMSQALIPLNFASPCQSADYVVTGHWSQTAIKQAKPYVAVNEIASGESFNQPISPSQWRRDETAAYLHYTANETIHGVAIRQTPAFADSEVPLVADFSSSIASEPVDVRDFGIIYAGAQKNLGPVGISVMVIRKDLLERAGQTRADILDYRSHVLRDSMLNTPPTFNWYLLGLTVAWMLKQGGTAAFKLRNEAKAKLLYDVIDGSEFYRNDVAADARSIMNVPFFLQTDELNAQFVSESLANGMLGLKGHKAIGGLRASIYNAMPIEGVEALVAFMHDFEKRHG